MKKRIQHFVRIHGTEEYAPVPKSVIRQLERSGHRVKLDDRFSGKIYIEVEEK